MIKKILLLLLITTLTNCGYSPIYSKKNSSDLIINKYQLNGDKKLDRKIISLLGLKSKNKENTDYELILESKKILETVAKDKTDSISVYRTSVSVKILLNKNNKKVKKKEFNSAFTYNNLENKFDLSEYQKNIEKNLIDKIAEEIFIFLNT